MVTKQQLDALRSRRGEQHPTLDYTPNGNGYKRIGAEQDLLREHTIKQGERTMAHSSEKMRSEYARAFSHGKAKADFNQSNKQNQKQEITL